jgi:hypothetical protein
LNVSILHGLRSWRRQIRIKVSLPISRRSAMQLVLQMGRRVTSTRAMCHARRGHRDRRSRPSTLLPPRRRLRSRTGDVTLAPKYAPRAFTLRALDSAWCHPGESATAATTVRWRMQVELVNRKRRNTRLDVAKAIFEYLEIFHNRQQPHSSLRRLARSNTRSAMPTSRLEIRQTNRANPGAHKSSHRSRTVQ